MTRRSHNPRASCSMQRKGSIVRSTWDLCGADSSTYYTLYANARWQKWSYLEHPCSSSRHPHGTIICRCAIFSPCCRERPWCRAHFAQLHKIKTCSRCQYWCHLAFFSSAFLYPCTRSKCKLKFWFSRVQVTRVSLQKMFVMHWWWIRAIRELICAFVQTERAHIWRAVEMHTMNPGTMHAIKHLSAAELSILMRVG